MEVGAPQLPTAKPSRGTQGRPPLPAGLRLRGCHPLRRGFPAHFGFPGRGVWRRAPCNPTSPRAFARGFGLGSPPFGRPYSGDPYWFLLLPLLRCFRSGGSHSVLPPQGGGFPSAAGYSPAAGGPIRGSPDQRLRAPTRGLSQLATPFVGARAEPSTGRLSRAGLAGASLVYAAAGLYAALTAARPARPGRSALHPGGLASRVASQG